MIDRPRFGDASDDADAFDEDVLDEDVLDEEFPLGDGTADTTGTIACPYCGEESELALDPGSGAAQDYVEDCPVCCRPWHVHVRYRSDGGADVTAERIQDA